MWYRTAQGLNIVSPFPGLPGYTAPAPSPVAPDQPQFADPDDPASQEQQPLAPDPTAGMARPPLHDRCHCEIITMLGGNTIWRTNGHCCPQCDQAREAWNAVSSPQDDQV